MKHIITTDVLPKEGPQTEIMKQFKKPYTAGDELIFEHDATSEQKTGIISEVVVNDKAFRIGWRLVKFEVK